MEWRQTLAQPNAVTVPAAFAHHAPKHIAGHGDMSRSTAVTRPSSAQPRSTPPPMLYAALRSTAMPARCCYAIDFHYHAQLAPRCPAARHAVPDDISRASAIPVSRRRLIAARPPPALLMLPPYAMPCFFDAVAISPRHAAVACVFAAIAGVISVFIIRAYCRC